MPSLMLRLFVCGFLGLVGGQLSGDLKFPALYPEVAQGLPSLTLTELRKCLGHRSGTPTSACVNIANPATASSSLEKAFTLHPAFANYSTRLRRPLFHAGVVAGSKQAVALNFMHSHVFTVHHYKQYLRRKRLPEPSCYVMTVRDPAERLESAFRESCAEPRCHAFISVSDRCSHGSPRL